MIRKKYNQIKVNAKFTNIIWRIIPDKVSADVRILAFRKISNSVFHILENIKISQ